MSSSTRLVAAGVARTAGGRVRVVRELHFHSLLRGLDDVTSMLHSRKAWAFAWTGWAAGVTFSFAWLESAALRKNSHPTFSTTLRRVLGIYPQTSWSKIVLIAVAGFWTWLVVHIAHVPDDVFYGIEPSDGSWTEVSPNMWYRVPRHRKFV
jgi:hypothetical protein